MGKTIRFGNVVFDIAFHQATTEDGSEISFTKSERLILSELTRHPDTIYSRNKLLDIVSEQGSDASDRNIDFTINRIRKKLQDSARAPKFITTHYGEGYSWICHPHNQISKLSGAYIVIGPVHGIGQIDGITDEEIGFANLFTRELSAKMKLDQNVILDFDCPPAEDFDEDHPKYSVELYFIKNTDDTNCIFTLKKFKTNSVLLVNRITLCDKKRSETTELADEMVSQISNAIWRQYISDSSINSLPDSTPLHISLHEVASSFSNSDGNWKDNDQRLRQAVADDDKDAIAKLMLATNINLKYIESGMETMLGPDTRIQDDNEIESLVLACLPHIQSSDVLVLAAAKLLFFLDRGYKALAIEMAEHAFKNSTAIASSLTIVGQMRMFRGKFSEATSLLDQALELSKEGTQFQYYLMFIKCQCYLAEGNWAKLREALDAFFDKVPEARYTVSIFFASAGEDNIQPESRAMAEHLTEEQAIAILKLTNYVYVRLFSDREPKINVFKGLITLMRERFGESVFPEEVRNEVPEFFGGNGPTDPRISTREYY